MALSTETKTKIKLADLDKKDPNVNKIHFPKGFLLGAAAASHQVEGQNTHSDWWYWEQQGRVPKSGMSADHYNRFEEDFQIAHDIGLNAMRISISWPRIEPEEGKWDKDAVEHYRKVLKTMKKQGLTRVVTLWHWVMPKWFADKGGFEKKEGVEAFARYAWFIAENLGSEIDLWVTLNEPETYSQLAYVRGRYPPFRQSKRTYWNVLGNLITAHKRAYSAIKKAFPKAQIGIAKNVSYYEPYRKMNLMDQLIVFFAKNVGNHYFYEKIQKHMDFVGVNYYFFNKVRFDWRRGYEEMNRNFMKGQMQLDDQENRSDMGWVLHPEGLYHLLLDLRKYKKPIYITENGLADAIDNRRPKFLRESLQWVEKAIKKGADVKGYFHWSLTDNYEWTEGYGPRFGLVEIDYTTQKRTIRKSTEVLKEVQIG
jgi:beta-glucosidase